MGVHNAFAKPRSHPSRFTTWLGGCLLLVFWVGSGGTVDAVSTTPTNAWTVTNLAGLYQIPDALRDVENPARLRVKVLLYDPIWKVLWLKDDADAMYLDSSQRALPIRTGQELDIDGLCKQGGGGLNWDKCAINVLREKALSDPELLDKS